MYEEELQALQTKIVHATYSERFESFQDPGHLETAVEELRERSDMDIAGFKAMLDAAYKDKIARV